MSDLRRIKKKLAPYVVWVKQNMALLPEEQMGPLTELLGFYSISQNFVKGYEFNDEDIGRIRELHVRIINNNSSNEFLFMEYLNEFNLRF